MLQWNQDKVKNLSPVEIWLFIIGRVLAGFGLGILGTLYFPNFIGPLGLPALIIGLIILIIAAKGLRRK